MEFKGTKGEWVYKQGFDSEGFLQTHFNIRAKPHKARITPIAKTYSETQNLDEAKANAQLIAAAPELLEKLKDAVNHMDQVHNGESIDYDVVYECREAINKALGTN